MKVLEIKKEQLLELCKSLLNDYCDILSSNELNCIRQINNQLNITNPNEEILKFSSAILEPIVKKVWDIELESKKYRVISWDKYEGKKPNAPIIFATISTADNIISFCNLTTGIEYEITYASLIGALPKDGATLIEDEARKNEYTIGYADKKVINSYNLATKLITPKQLVELEKTSYYTNYNELILDATKIKEIGYVNLDKRKRI